MHPLTIGIDIAHLQSQALAETQSQAIDGEVENPVTEGVSCQEQTLGFINGNDIRQALGPWRFDQPEINPGLMQHMGVEEFKTVEFQLDGAPGMRLQPIGAIIDQLRFGQVIALFIEILANTPKGSGIGLYRLGLEPFELQVFKVGLIVLLEIGFK